MSECSRPVARVRAGKRPVERAKPFDSAEHAIRNGVIRRRATAAADRVCVRSWPMRCVRSIARASTAGLHPGSKSATSSPP
jgi:hypothetical protein